MVSQVLDLGEAPEISFRSSIELADLVGAKIYHVKVRSLLDETEHLLKPNQEPGRYKKCIGFRCHTRLYEMATLDDHATIADKICLANDLKDRRDHIYAKALLCHIFPQMPHRHQSAALQSYGLKAWLKSDPRGQWCSQNDKAFMYMTVKNYICNNREEIASSLWQKQGNDGAAAMPPSEHTLSDDQVQLVINSWRGPHLENLEGAPWESTTSGHIGSPSNIPRPKPLDNSISPPVFRTGWLDDPICPEPLDLAKAGNLRAQQQYERFLVGIPSENHQGEKDQDNSEDFGGAQESMSKSEAQELEKALSGMHLGTPSREISKQQTGVNSSRPHDAHIAVRRQQVREMKRRHAAETLFNVSAKALMYACRKQSTHQNPGTRRSMRLASEASKTLSDNLPRKDTGRVGKANQNNNPRHSRKLRRDQQCDEDVSRFRLNPRIDLPRKRLNQVRKRLGPAVMSEMDEMYRREQRQKMTSAAPLTSLGTVEDDSAKAHAENSWRHETGLLGPANEEAVPCDSNMEFDSIESRMEWMDTS